MLKTTDIMTLDTICNEFVANLRAGDDSTIVVKLKPPYDMMTELDEISSGREKRSALELLLSYVVNHPHDAMKISEGLQSSFNSKKLDKDSAIQVIF